MPKIIINLAAVYETDVLFADSKFLKNWFARLRRHGFKRSAAGEAYYHPKHWKSLGMGTVNVKTGKVLDSGDYWIMQDAFRSKTLDAKVWIKSTEEV